MLSNFPLTRLAKDQTMPEGARAAGQTLDEYRWTRHAVNWVIETLDFQGKIDGPKEMDTTLADPVMRQRLTVDPFTLLSPESAATLRSRMDRLVPLWIEYVNLTAVSG
jgi:hypothetical protein